MNTLERIQELCKIKGINPTKLENELGLGKGTLYKWDKSFPNTDKISKVADYFDVSVDYLLGREDLIEQMTMFGYSVHEERKILGCRLKELREEHNMSVKDFAKLFSIPAKIVMQYEEGLVVPKNIEVFAEYFGINEKWLLGADIEEKYKKKETGFLTRREIGERIKKEREKQGLSLDEFADKTGINVRQLERFERGIRELGNFTIQNMSKALNVSVEWLLGGENAVKKFIGDKYFQHTKIIPVYKNLDPTESIFEQPNLIDYEYVPYIHNIDFCMEILDDSMTNARIGIGDIAFMSFQNTVENGDIVLIRIRNEEFILRRYLRYGNQIVLRSENSKYSELTFPIEEKSQNTEYEILAKCLYVKFKVL